MSKTKKIISLLLSVIMILSAWSIVPFSASAAEADTAETGTESGTTGDCTWTLDNGELTISGNGKMGDYDSTYKNGSWVTTAPWGSYSFYTVVIEPGVTSIGDSAFFGCTGLTSVTIPDSVTSIGGGAFYSCTGLTSVTIPDSVTSIDMEAFYWCTGLTSVTIPDSVTSIGYKAFCNCTGLTSVTIPDSVTSIGDRAFFNCTGLTSIAIPDSVTSIGNSAFGFCYGLTSIAIPDSVTSIGDGAFAWCTGLTSVTIPDSVTSISDSAFSSCTGLTSVTIPDSVTSIGGSAFYDCTGLTSITIPNSVSSIGGDAFDRTAWYDNQPDGLVYAGKVAYKMKGDCPSEIVIKDGTLGIAGSAFEDCRGLTSVYIPDSVTSIGEEAFYWCKGLTSVTIGNSVTSIGDRAFYDCTSLTSVTIPDSVTSIGWCAFLGCTGLTSIKVAEGNTVYDSRNDCNAIVKTESNELIYGCLNTVIPDSVTSIGSFAFSGYSGLTSIDIPDSVTSIGNSAFSGCTGLTSITIPGSVTSIGVGAFEFCYGLTSIDIPDSVTSIGEYAFYRCTGLTSVTIPDSVTSIGKSAFEYTAWYDNQPEGLVYAGKVAYKMKGTCPSEVIIKDGTLGIADSAFEGCESLMSVTIPDSVTSIGRSAFSGCKGLTSVNIGNSVTSIGGIAFSGCTSLTSIDIPDSVKSIGEWAFYKCTGLTSVTIGNSVTSIGEQAFSGCKSLKSITIPSSVTNIGDNAFGDIESLTIYGYKGSAAEKYAKDNGLRFISLTESENTDYKYDIQDDGTAVITGYTGGDGDITIPSTLEGYTVTSIGSSAFSECTGLTSITIPDSVTSIGDWAFFSCTGLTSIAIPDSVKSIGDYAFNNCYSLTNITIPDSVTSISFCTFYRCEGLTSVTIPDSVTSIGDGAFGFCAGLTSIDIPDSVTSIGEGAFSACTSLTSIDIPDSVTSISDRAFFWCESLKSVTVPDSVTSIGKQAFSGCKSLKSITIPSSVTSIGNYAFSDIESLTIYGYKGSAAETYAEANDITFVSLDSISISDCTITLGTSSYTYDGTEKKPTVTVKDGNKTLSSGTDYTVAYSNNKNVGTATATVTGKGKYTGTASKTYKISAKSISSATVTLGATSYTYDGTEKKPTVTVKDGNKTLSSGTDYTVAYSDNKNVGTATATVTGKGNYTGTASKTFTITEKSKTDISKCTVTLSQTSYTYDGNEKKPTVTVKDGNKTLSSGTDYTVAYSDNKNVGTAAATVTGKGNYSGTKSVSFTINPKQDTGNTFTWGEGNWNFNNSASQGYFLDSTYRKQISSDYLEVLKNNLTNSEYQCIFVGTWYSDAWLDDVWGGSCYGMSSTTLLAKQGLLPYSDYKSGAAKLHDLDSPVKNSKVSSLITYYQMLQVKDVIQQQYRTVPYLTNEENISRIIELLDTNPTVLIGFQKSGWGGHAILATGYEYGSWTWNGVAYQGCIRICDPNASLGYDKNFNIYFNTKTFNWIIPAYNKMTSVNGAKFNYVGADVSEINKGGYLSGSAGTKSNKFVARIDADAISDNRSVSKVESQNGNYITRNTAPGDIIEDYSYILGNESEGKIGYNLYDAGASYRVSQENPEELQLSINYENCNYYAGSKSGKEVIFDPSGYIQVEGDSAEYNMTMSFNDDYPTEWFTVQVKGSGADISSLRKAEDGYIVSSDNLNNVTVTANNRDVTVACTFSTGYDSALIYGINETQIGIKVDTDNNGTYETDIAAYVPTCTLSGRAKSYLSDSDKMTIELLKDDQRIDMTTAKGMDSVYSFNDVESGTYVLRVTKEDHVTREYTVTVSGSDTTQDVELFPLGDVTGDGKTNVQDCTAILRYVRKLDTLSDDQFGLGDVTGDGKVNVQDVTRILRHVRRIEELY